MKFLIFNLAVAAALAFLFTADRSDVQRVAGQLHATVDNVKDYAREALNDGKAALGATPSDVTPKTPPSPRAENRLAVPPVAPEPPTPPRDDRTKENPRQSVPPKPAAPPRTAIAKAEPATRPSESVTAQPPGLDPAIAQRRREVLAGIETAGAAPALKQGTRLMSPADRRRELLSLAEDMELLYARSVGR